MTLHPVAVPGTVFSLPEVPASRSQRQQLRLRHDSSEMTKAMTENEIRDQLQSVLDEMDQSYTWVSGEINLMLRSGRQVAGQLQRLEPASAIIDGPRGMESVLTRNIVGLTIRMVSPGPE